MIVNASGSLCAKKDCVYGHMDWGERGGAGSEDEPIKPAVKEIWSLSVTSGNDLSVI